MLENIPMLDHLHPLVILGASGFLTSAISGAIGMLGGILLLSVMTLFYPPALLIPLHGTAQWVSNGTRTWLFRNHIQKKIVFGFVLGVTLGTLLGHHIYVDIPEALFKVLLGFFILLMTWMPPIKTKWTPPGKFFLLGGIATFLSLFIGATGPLIAPFFIRENLDKMKLVGTKAACQLFVHSGKLVVFFLSGFAFSEYWKEIIVLSISVIAGNKLGKSLLQFIPEKAFRIVFKLIISLLSVRMLHLGYQSFTGKPLF
ncbi:MAG: hypothetical protein CL678_07090 [Bdellovibrionaceae bacterium]|nr:hypothetical protein [Pseudobdellovibrionaceae bacterium]|tara:strand:- start:1445 stop:2215 length:771 start_codon:yes stop_codon:yes gene_type:complete